MNRLLILIAFVVSACAGSQPPSPEASAAPPPPVAEEPKKPETAPAPEKPGIEVSAMDKSVKPCDDFFAYACGNWIKNNEIPADKSRWTRFDQLGESSREKLKDILEAFAAGKFESEDRFGEKVGDFYAACMDEAGVEKTGLADLKAEWKKIDKVKGFKALSREVGRLHAEGVGVLFYFGSMQDYKDSTKVIAAVYQGGLSLPDRDYYIKDDDKSKQIRKDYLAHLEKMLTLAGVPKKRAKKEAQAVFDLEKSMAESFWTKTEMRDPRKRYNPMDLKALQKATGRFSWKDFLLGIGAPDRTTAFSASTPKALARLAELLKKKPMTTFKAYLRWKALDSGAETRALPKAFVDERFAFVSKSFTGAKELQARWKHCTDLTDQMLGEALGQAFVRRWFAGDAKTDALTLIKNVQGAMGENLKALEWMDQATRDKAGEKLGRIRFKIGYPDKWRDYSSVEVTRDSFLKSLLSAVAYETRRDLDKIGKPVDREEWFLSPPRVNAYFHPLLNEMVYPAGILQPMFYTQGANHAVNYGAIGYVMGHELTHGFDDQGRKFDADGNMKDWWSPEVAKKFEERTVCTEKQYADYPAVEDVKLNGKLTLGENIADLGGLKLSLAAYRASRKEKPPEADVEGFTPEQQFFLSAGQVWCGNMRPEEARRRAITDPHSPPRWRVNGPLSVLPDFAAAFGCQASDPMVRKERCEVW